MMPLSELLSHLDADSAFASEALHELDEINRHLKVKSTYTIASAAAGLVNQWLVERELKCYERNREVEDVTEAVVSKDDIDLGIAMIEDSWKINTDEFCLLLKGKGMTIPDFLNAESQLAHEQAESGKQSTRPLRQQRFQEREILRVIGDLKYTANDLPKRERAGQPWVKAEVRAKLTFSEKVFNKAWERLRNQGDIKETT